MAQGKNLITLSVLLFGQVFGNFDHGHDRGYMENGFDDSGMFLDTAEDGIFQDRGGFADDSLVGSGGIAGSGFTGGSEGIAESGFMDGSMTGSGFIGDRRGIAGPRLMGGNGGMARPHFMEGSSGISGSGFIGGKDYTRPQRISGRILGDSLSSMRSGGMPRRMPSKMSRRMPRRTPFIGGHVGGFPRFPKMGGAAIGGGILGTGRPMFPRRQSSSSIGGFKSRGNGKHSRFGGMMGRGGIAGMSRRRFKTY